MSETDIEIPDIDAPYSPRATRDVIGQERAINSFLRACETDRLAHAWLFSGPKGSGKMSLALNIARCFLETGVPQSREQIFAAFDLPQGHLITRGVHPDIRIMQRKYDAEKSKFKQSIEIHDVRDLTRFFSHSSGRGGWRIAIVDCLDDMTLNAANALLKLVEEPPSKCLLILINHNSGRLLDTLRSRTRRLSFSGLSLPNLMQILTAYLPDEPEQKLQAASFLASGSAHKALRLATGDGLEQFQRLIDSLLSARDGDLKTVHEFSDFIVARDQPDRFALFFELLSDWIMRVTRAKTGVEAYQPLYQSEPGLVEAIAAGSSYEQLIGLWEKINENGRSAMALNLDRKQTVMMSLLLVSKASVA
jgi:DNA polymerase-3 subunit delta'